MGEVKRYIAHFGVKGMSWYHRYHQGYDTRPTRSGKVGVEHFKELTEKYRKNPSEELRKTILEEYINTPFNKRFTDKRLLKLSAKAYKKEKSIRDLLSDKDKKIWDAGMDYAREWVKHLEDQKNTRHIDPNKFPKDNKEWYDHDDILTDLDDWNGFINENKKEYEKLKNDKFKLYNRKLDDLHEYYSETAERLISGIEDLDNPKGDDEKEIKRIFNYLDFHTGKLANNIVKEYGNKLKTLNPDSEEFTYLSTDLRFFKDAYSEQIDYFKKQYA